MTVATERRLIFGEVAELYERVRPAYPEALVQDVIALSGADRALEVGAGTGKATRLFADRGVAVHALEPSAEMAAVARRVCAPYEHVEIEECEFERFGAPRERFALVFSGQAWHWIRPEVGYMKAREALVDGGLLAAFWNRPRWNEVALHPELVEAYRRAAPGFDPAAGPDPMHPATEMTPTLGGDWLGESEAAAGFERPETRSYDWQWTHSTTDYLELLQTHSGHMIRPPAERKAILAEVGAAIDRNGGTFEMAYVTVLCLAFAA